VVATVAAETVVVMVAAAVIGVIAEIVAETAVIVVPTEDFNDVPDKCGR